MKKLIAGILLAFMGMVLVQAQFNTDSKMVGASSAMNFGLFSQKDAASDVKTKTINFNLNPRFGYFVDNMFAAGMDMGISTSRTKIGDLDPYSYHTYTLGFFSRYYYQTAAPVVPFGEINAGLGRSVSKSVSAGETVKSKHNIFYLGAGGGAAFFVADNFALEGLLLYNFNRQKNPDTDGKHNRHGLMLEFGFTFFFNSLLQE
jgi:hypothetical protein